MKTNEDVEMETIGSILLGGLALVMVSSMVLIGFWGSILWIGLLMVYVGLRLL